MLRLCTINAGDYCGRGVEYTNKLLDMIRRNLAYGTEGTFTVFTDTPGDYHPDIEVVPLPAIGLEGWWNKLALFKRDLFPKGDRIVYFDLSCLITGRIDDIVAYDGTFAILRDFYRPDGLQSAIMAWEAGTLDSIWDSWNTANRPLFSGGDQTWIEQCCRNSCDLWQDLFPGKFVSFKINPEIPGRAAIVKFHGEPKPHQIIDGWVPKVWKIGGLTRAELDNICNTENEKLLDNIRTNSTRNLPWFEPETGENKQACIVGGGPSLKNQVEALKWRKSQSHTIIATNGSHDWLLDHGIVPDWHVIVDARPENVRFVSRPQKGVRYFIGSQCDPSILEALEGHDVVLFHNSSPGARSVLEDSWRPVTLLGGGTTVVLKAMTIAEFSGHRALHLYGVDSCYLDGEHHAYEQTANDGEHIIDLLYEDRTFKVAGWMASQAQDFVDFCRRFTGIVTVAGNGLLAYVAECGIPEIAADIRAREILRHIKPGAVGVEVGVFAGELSARLLCDERVNRLHMVDSWGVDHPEDYAKSGDFHATLTKDQQSQYMQMALRDTEFAREKRTVLRMSSTQAASHIADESLDFVFIDADHSYEAVKADLRAWFPKLKPGALLSGHDYENTDYPAFGVKQAVDEFITEHGLTLERGENFCWFARVPSEALTT